MTFAKVVDRACEEPTLVKALAFIALYETSRIVDLARRNEQDGTVGPNGELWDSCYEFLFARVMKHYARA